MKRKTSSARSQNSRYLKKSRHIIEIKARRSGVIPNHAQDINFKFGRDRASGFDINCVHIPALFCPAVGYGKLIPDAAGPFDGFQLGLDIIAVFQADIGDGERVFRGWRNGDRLLDFLAGIAGKALGI